MTEPFRVLAIESSAKAASCAIVEDGKLIASSFRNNGLTHSVTLLPMAEALLKDCSLEVKDLSLIAVAAGPGSFTGIRIGVAAAKGLMWGAEIPGVGVSTLEAMAWSCRALEGCVICPAMDARRGQIYNALFEIKNQTPVRIAPDRAISVEELAEELKKLKKSVFIVGDGAELCYNKLDKLGIGSALAPEDMRFQSAEGVAYAALALDPSEWGKLEPVYLRKSQAERERDEKLCSNQ
jgi:tRNA threonylcarbamoyladenosine biosynthesis protein TsaB